MYRRSPPVYPLIARRMTPDVVAKQTGAHGPLRPNRLSLLLPVLASLVFTAIDCCAPALTIHAHPSPGWDRTYGSNEGMASFYGRKFNGRRTASGERFDMNKFTAAHRTLPFGTMVRITDVASGKSVVVRINDRGPFSRSRIIDMSRAAAAALGIIGKGRARVRIEVVE